MGLTRILHCTVTDPLTFFHSFGFRSSGFEHTAFALRAESRLDQSPYFDYHVPRGELVELLTKALLYIEVETHCKGEGLISDCKAPFRLLKRHACAADPLDDINGTATEQNGKRTSVPPGGLTDAQLKRKADTPADGDMHDRRVKRSAEPDSGDGEPMVLDCESLLDTACTSPLCNSDPPLDSQTRVV